MCDGYKLEPEECFQTNGTQENNFTPSDSGNYNSLEMKRPECLPFVNSQHVLFGIRKYETWIKRTFIKLKKQYQIGSYCKKANLSGNQRNEECTRNWLSVWYTFSPVNESI